MRDIRDPDGSSTELTPTRCIALYATVSKKISGMKPMLKIHCGWWWAACASSNQQELDGCRRKVTIVLWLTICHSSYTHTSFRSTYTNRIWKKISKNESVKELGSDINRNWWLTERLPRVQSGKTMPTSFLLIICPRALRVSGKKSLTTDSPERPVETSSRGYTELFIMSRRGI